MPVIKPVRREVSMPGSLGQARADVGLYDPIARGAEGVGNAIQRVGQQLEEKKRTAEITNMDTAFRDWSRERLMEDRQTRQGQAALGDEETPDVYKAYDDDAEKRIGEMVAKLPVRYQAVAKQRLSSVAEGYRDRYAGYLSEQLQAHRQATIQNSVNTTITELSHDLETGAGIGAIKEAMGTIKGVAEVNSGGQDVSDLVRKYQADALTQAITAMADKNPKSALELMKDDSVKNVLNAKERKTLSEFIDKERIDKEAEAFVAEVATLPYEEQVAKAGKISDPEVARKAVSEVNFRKQTMDAAEIEAQSNRIDQLHKQIFVNGNPPSPLEVDKDQTLTPSQKQTVKAWIEGGKAGSKMADGDRQTAWLVVQDKIRRKLPGYVTKADIMQKAGTEYDSRDMKSLVGEYEDELQGNGIASRVRADVDALYPEVDNTLKAQAIFDISASLREERQKTGLPASPEVIQKKIIDALQPLREKRWQERIPFVERPGRGTKPQASFVALDSKERPIPQAHRSIVRNAQVAGESPVRYEDAVTTYYKGRGFKEPAYRQIDQTDVFILGERDGKFGYDAGDGIRWLDPEIPDQAEQIEILKTAKAEGE